MKKPEELLEWIEKLKESDAVIIVEGKEDRAALERLGIGNIIQLNKKARRNQQTFVFSDPSRCQLESDSRLVAGSQFAAGSRATLCGRTARQGRTTSGLRFSQTLPSCIGINVVSS